MSVITKEESLRPKLPDEMTKSDYEDGFFFYEVPDWLKNIIHDDDVDKFMEKFPCPKNECGSLSVEEKDAQKPTLCPKAIVSFIFMHRAVNCAIALLEGDTCLTLNPNHPCLLGRYPLHDAAEAMSYDLVDLLLRHGALADVRTIEVKPYTRGGLLPLSVALENLRLHHYLLAWTPEQSILKLILIFCLPQMKAPLKICKLLALSTTDVVEVFNGYCMDGKLFEVVGLLMVAHEKLNDAISEGSLIRKRMVEEITHLVNEEIKLCMTSKSVQASKNRIKNLQQTLSVLEVFERTGCALVGYVENIVHYYSTLTRKADVVNDVKKLLVGRGFVLTRKDTNLSDIDCEHGNAMLALHMLETKLDYGNMSLLGGSQLGNVARKVMYYKNRDWAMRRCFAKIPILRHGIDMSRPNLHFPRPQHFDESFPIIRFIRRGYFSTAWAVKKGLSYL